jgi:hypothetical protein
VYEGGARREYTRGVYEGGARREYTLTLTYPPSTALECRAFFLADLDILQDEVELRLVHLQKGDIVGM